MSKDNSGKKNKAYVDVVDMLWEEAKMVHEEFAKMAHESFKDDRDKEILGKARNETYYERLHKRLRAFYAQVHALDPGRSALCLSGGGIRSASFCLGVLQSLARAGVLDKFHYLSTVSG